jgi:hypothetical protein
MRMKYSQLNAEFACLKESLLKDHKINKKRSKKLHLFRSKLNYGNFLLGNVSAQIK